MILKGSQRSGARQLAAHLLNDRDNDHVTTLDIRGFVADDLHGALDEAHAISKATKCKQYLFSLSLNPPRDADVGEASFVAAADQAEKALGLDGQPRAIIMHEKDGRRHAHVVWSRIDADRLTAINLPHFKNRLNVLARDLYLEHGWDLPDGLKTHGGKNPLNFTLAEWQQARRMALDPREIKTVFQEAWKRSDSLKGFGNALAERGYFLALGDRRGVVAINVDGDVFSVSRWLGVRTKEVRAKLGSADGLEPVDAVQKAVKARVTTKLRSFIDALKDRHRKEMEPLHKEKQQLVQDQRQERDHLQAQQDKRWREESAARAARFRKGFKGLFDSLTGRAKAIQARNEAELYDCFVRDRAQRDALVRPQLQERKTLQRQIDALRTKQTQDRALMARDVTQFLRRQERRSSTDVERPRTDREHEAMRPRSGGRRSDPRFEL